MTATSVDLLKHYAFALRSADPDSYQAFLTALEAYATEITVAVTNASPDTILNMQGRAKQTLVLLDTLRKPKPYTPPQPAPAP